MKLFSAAIAGTLLGISIFFMLGQYLFVDFTVPQFYLTIMQIPLSLGRNFQVFLISTLLALSVIAYEKYKRKKQASIFIPPALHHKVTSILDPSHAPISAAGESVSYAFEVPQPSRIKQFALLLPLAIVTFFLSAIVSNKLLSKEVATISQATPSSAVLSVTTQSINTLVPDTNVSVTPSKRLVINEVYYKPDSGHRINNSTNESEWIEIFNPGTETISLSGWSVKDADECDNLPGEFALSPGNIAIITPATKASFETKWSVNPMTQFISIPGRIGNGLDDTDEIVLKSSNCTASTAEIVDQVRWGDNLEFAIQQNNPATPGIK